MLSIAAFLLSVAHDAPDTLRNPPSTPPSEARATRLAAAIVLARLEAWDTSEDEIVTPRMVTAREWYAADATYGSDDAPATLRSGCKEVV
jgi:hypothetical protein